MELVDGKWILVAKTQSATWYQAISVINIEDYWNFCKKL